MVPGEPEARSREKRLAEGIPLATHTWRAILDAARSVDVDEVLIGKLPEA
jgi:uncharacterized oxidoreductase